MSDDPVRAYLDRLVAVLGRIPIEPLHQMNTTLSATYQLGHTILTCGNGGSAATASHLACDLAKMTRHDMREPVRALCLNDSLPMLTAWANDTTYTQALAEVLRGLGRPGDVLIAISASGRSPNVLQAAVWARAHKLHVLALTGGDGGELLPLAETVCVVPSHDPQMVEDTHIAICHILTGGLARAVVYG